MKKRVFFVVSGALAVAGCLDASDCDPNAVSNVVTSGLCSNDGVFDERRAIIEGNLKTINAEVERERIALSRANSRIRNLQAQQRLSSSQVADINRELDAQSADLNRLSRTSDPQRAANLRAKLKERKAKINRLARVAVL